MRIPWWLMTFGAEYSFALRHVLAQLLSRMQFSQTELARELGVEQPTVSRWAAGQALPESWEQVLNVVAALEHRVSEIQEAMATTRKFIAALKNVHDSGQHAERRAGMEKLEKLIAKHRIDRNMNADMRKDEKQTRGRRSRR